MRRLLAWLDATAERLADSEWNHRPRRNRLLWAAVLTAEATLVTVPTAWLLRHAMGDGWPAWAVAVVTLGYFTSFIWTVALDPRKGFKLGLCLIPVVTLVVPIGLAAVML